MSNCTVTMDGPHSFASLRIASGGVLTHSDFPFGISAFVFYVTNEPHILSSANPATLLNSNATLSLFVTDEGGDTTYTNGVDYLTMATTNGLTELLWTNTSSIADGATVLVSYAWIAEVPAGLWLNVTGNVNIAPGGRMDATGNGYGNAVGPGRGTAAYTAYFDGSGGGYGGFGGYSASNAVGGICYGSLTQPTRLGSGGGNSYAGAGAFGGGVIQIMAGGTITVDGSILANGANATNSRAGGGSGGSIWIAAGILTGGGNISATGGAGDLYGGGGGGGGRIALYAPTNDFAGTTNTDGGDGFANGQAGTIFLSSVLNNFQVTSQTPSGPVSNTVSSVLLTLSDAIAPASVTASAFSFSTPGGPLPASSLSVATIGLNTVQVSFPTQDLVGNYTLQVPNELASILGQPLAGNYNGSFTIAVPLISGTITDTNDAAVAGVSLQPTGGSPAAISDANGNYTIPVPLGWSGIVTPSLNSLAFVPNSMVYTNLTNSLAAQNYLMVPTVAPNVSTSLSGTNLSLNWYGISGVTYQTMSSTNLVNWQPFGGPMSGANGVVQLNLSLDSEPSVFFRISATY